MKTIADWITLWDEDFAIAIAEPLVEVVVKQWVLHASSTVMHSISMTSQAMRFMLPYPPV